MVRISSSSLHRFSVAQRPGICAAIVGIAVLLPSVASAETMGNHMWNLRENPQSFFGANDSWVRPWEFNQDDGWGMFQGGHSGSFPWASAGASGNALDGSLSIDRGVDHQFSAWTYLYVPGPTTIALYGQGDCVPRWFLNYAFDSPQQFPLGSPATINLIAGWNRLDITGYNQVSDFLFESGALVGQVGIMNTSPIPEPSTLALLACGVLGFLFLGGKMLAKKLSLLSVVVLVALAGTAAQAATITGITLTDLGAGVTPNAINNVVQVVGQDASGQAFLWQAGTVTPLGTLGGSQSAANDINDSGVVVGWANLSNGRKAAFKWNGTMTNLDPTSSIDNVAEAMNPRGDIVGWRAGATTYRSVIWGYDGGWSNLFGSTNSKALGINENREVVGVTIDSLGQIRDGYYWDGSGSGINWTNDFLSYHPLAGINESSLSGGEEDGFAGYWKVGEGVNGIAKLDPADLSSLVCGLNDQGNLVGYSESKAFLFDLSDHSLYDLNAYLPGGSSFTQLTVANDINNSNAFIGIGLVGGVQHGFVGQIVVPEPSTLALLGIGALVLSVFGWRLAVRRKAPGAAGCSSASADGRRKQSCFPFYANFDDFQGVSRFHHEDRVFWVPQQNPWVD